MMSRLVLLNIFFEIGDDYRCPTATMINRACPLYILVQILYNIFNTWICILYK